MGRVGKHCIPGIIVYFIVLLAMPVWAGEEVVSVSYYDSYPLCFQDQDGQAQGIFVDVVNQVAAQEEWKVVYEYHTLEEQLDLVAAGKVDLGLAIAYSEERAQKVSYHEETIYGNWGQVYVGMDGRRADSMEELADLRVALVRGNIYSQYVEESFARLGLEADIVRVDGYSDVFRALDDGRADAGVVSRTFGLMKSDLHWVQATGLAIRPSKLMVIAAPGQSEYLAPLDTWIMEMKQDPESAYFRILSQWLREEVQSEVVPDVVKWILGLALAMGIISLGFVYFLRKLVGRQTRELHQLAYYDTLTGQANRQYIKEVIDDLDEEERRDFLLIDLDQFRRINDFYGIETGDQLLVNLGELISAQIPESGVMSRLGEDEFGILVAEGHGQACAQKVLEAVKIPVSIMGNSFQVGVTIGVARYPEDGVDPDDLINKAEMAMYQGKKKGQAKVQCFRSELAERSNQIYRYLSALSTAVEREEFHLVYQPIVDAQTQERVGVEALLRWEHEGVLISPKVFIPIAEQTGMIHEIGDWVVSEAARQFMVWQTLPDTPQFMSINLSAVQLNRQGFIDHLDDLVQPFGLKKSRMHFEVTEHAEIEKIGNCRLALDQLKSRGYCISLDDFGMGYSSMNYLKELPIDTMKIDRTFIMGIGQDRETEIMIEELLILAKRMKLMTIAEGVETKDQWLFLRQNNCQMIQGYYFGRPARPQELIEEKKD